MSTLRTIDAYFSVRIALNASDREMEEIASFNS